MAKLGDNNSRARGLSRVIGWPDGPPSQVRDLTAQCVVLAAENMVLSHSIMVVLIIALVLVGYSMNILCGGNFCWNTNDNDIKQRRFWGCDDVRTFYCKCNFLMNPNVRQFVGWLVGLSAYLSVGRSKSPKWSGRYTSMLLSEHLFFFYWGYVHIMLLRSPLLMKHQARQPKTWILKWIQPRGHM